MPRPPRLHVSGGMYHVILRGNHREPLFSTAADRVVLNDIVADVFCRMNARIHAFCWMTNHLHALAQISDRPLGSVIQRVAQRYARYRHKRLATTGHLFERRHHAKLVDIDTYFLTVLRYIHLNPVKAHLASSPASYPWSSHRAYLGVATIPWLTSDFGLSLFSSDLKSARSAYRNFMSQPCDAGEDDGEIEAHPADSRILGSDRFIASIAPVSYRPRGVLTLTQLAESICSTHKIDIDLLCSPSRARCLTPYRVELVNKAIELRVATLTETARFLGRHPSTLIQLVSRHS